MSTILDDEKDYPWRASLTKTARCFYCSHFFNDDSCALEHQVVYPLINGEHHCPDYVYVPDKIPKIDNPFAVPESEYCVKCSKFFQGACSGKSWIPIHIKNGRCEFFRDMDKTCKNAIPFLQYGNHIRNNYCKLPPHLRDGDCSRGWKWCCPQAHTEHIENKKCYRPMDA